VDNIQTWFQRLSRFAPITHLALEVVRFDTQRMQNPEISGVEYQQGTLYGYEVREYLLEKWGRKCAYCGAENVPLQVEHIVPRSRGGSDRVSNLTLACGPCNQAKGNQTATEYGHPDIQRKAKQPLNDAAAVNATRWAIYRRLAETGLPLELGTGSRTRFNRRRQNYPKTHWLDAVCVGESGGAVYVSPDHAPLLIQATGRGTRQMCGTDKYGFPRRHRTRQKRFFGFQTGDIVRANVPKGKYAGIHVGRVSCRKTGSFDIRTATGRVQGISHHHCISLHKSDGYNYAKGAALSSTAVNES
jgi:5-methylcytosine-specific restriction endonuclease McrA